VPLSTTTSGLIVSSKVFEPVAFPVEVEFVQAESINKLSPNALAIIEIDFLVKN
jgi:hypothetical protein